MTVSSTGRSRCSSCQEGEHKVSCAPERRAGAVTSQAPRPNLPADVLFDGGLGKQGWLWLSLG